MKYTPQQIGQLVKKARKTLGVTQKDLALTSGTGLRFIIELEQGKPTCQIGKVLTVLHTLGITVELTLPTGGGTGERVRP
ncbi:MAG: helix-turn-helix transcriptional regulator [Planctomycetota bacterium]|nr:helix-turn-helix transcriptional regulator [Planctomycetota bacterium]